MPVLDIQRRSQQIGRIRIGQQVPTGKRDADGKEKMRPARLDTFRFTSPSERAAHDVVCQIQMLLPTFGQPQPATGSQAAHA